MRSRSHATEVKSKRGNARCFNIPIECIRKTRSLNVDNGSCFVSREVYKILKSDNGRKMFTPCHGMLKA